MVRVFGLISLLALFLIYNAAVAYAQTDEIQVYDGEIENQGKFNPMVHSNVTPIGRTTPDFPGGIIPNDSVNGAAEWAYSVTDRFEQGLYLAVYTAYSEGRVRSINRFKIRELLVRPRAHDHSSFYGVNFELSVNYKYWETRRITFEVRPIVGLHLHRVAIIFNPIVDTNYIGGLGNLEFVPATRIAYNVNDKWAVAFEGYADSASAQLPQTGRPSPRGLGGHGSFQQVPEYRNRRGVGVTAGADGLTSKLMLSRDLN